MSERPLYPRCYHPWDLEPYYSRHVSAMTTERLDSKADIAEQLAWRDKRIEELGAKLDRERWRADENGNYARIHFEKRLAAEKVLDDSNVVALQLVALEAAAMLAETNHGGLSFKRSESMRLALEGADVPIPPQCSACPHPTPR